jgi:hypothetical protein
VRDFIPLALNLSDPLMGIEACNAVSMQRVAKHFSDLYHIQRGLAKQGEEFLVFRDKRLKYAVEIEAHEGD